MYKGERDTGKWFKDDHQPMQQDRVIKKDMGPGKYNIDTGIKQSSPNQQISWNVREQNFGSKGDRFKKDFKKYFQPGPADYSPKAITAPTLGEATMTIPQLSPDSVLNANGAMTTMLPSPRGRDIIEMSRTA